MNTAQNDEALVQALKGVTLDTEELADLRRLYDAPDGVEYAPDATRQASDRIVRRCTSVGRRIGRCMRRNQRRGVDLIGYCDPDTGTWRMTPGFRPLMRELGWAEDAATRTLVEELDELDDFQEIESVAALVAQEEEAIRNSECVPELDREELVKARFGQGKFRAAVQVLEHGCRVTGMTEPGLLQAAHMKPWMACSNRERLDGANGLLLAPSFHLLFSKGYISFDAAGRLLVSASLPDRVAQGWSVAQRVSPRPFAPRQLEYLDHHTHRLFKP